MFIVFLLLPNKFPNEDKLFCIIRAGAQSVQYLKQKSVFFMAIIVLFKAIIKLRKTVTGFSVLIIKQLKTFEPKSVLTDAIGIRAVST